MGTLKDKISNINNSKQLIKNAIEEHGITVGNVRFREYPNLIREIGGLEPVNLNYNPYSSDVNDKIDYLDTTKTLIKEAIEAYDVSLTNIPFIQYATYIGDLSVGPIPEVGCRYRGNYQTPPQNSYELTGQSNLTYDGYMFDVANTNGTAAFFMLTNCSNVTIKNCYFKNASKDYAIILMNCSNVLIEDCVFEDVFGAVWAQECTGNIKIKYNDLYNTLGMLLRANNIYVHNGEEYHQSTYSQGVSIQLDTCTGGDNEISFNVLDNDIGMSNPKEFINTSGSVGNSNSRILIHKNYMRNGSSVTDNSAIRLGSHYDKYISASENIIEDGGQYGIRLLGGNYISLEDNTIYSKYNYFTMAGAGIDLAKIRGDDSPSNWYIYGNHSDCFININNENTWIRLEGGHIQGYVTNIATALSDNTFSGTTDNGNQLPYSIFGKLKKKTGGL